MGKTDGENMQGNEKKINRWREEKGMTFLLIFILSTLEIVSGERKKVRLGREFNSLAPFS